MSCHSSNSLVTTSDYSISEDDVYVFCRIASGPVDATKCQLSEGRHPAVESQIRCDRDPGFSEHEYSVEGFYTEISDLLMFKHNPESQKTCLERDDHVYYNLSSLREEKEACNYNNYPLLNVKALKKLNELLPKKKMHTKRTRPKPRSMDSQQSDISTMTVFSAGMVLHPFHLFQNDLINLMSTSVFHFIVTRLQILFTKGEKIKIIG
uniref:TBCC domain-containing protein n=1 Tax=Angiostrongylus cantonensis TaxID=6313 RepID=A0A0K0DKP2_ANGCA